MAAQTGLRRGLMSLSPGYGVGYGIAVHFHLEHGGAEFYLTVCGKSVKESVTHVLSGQIIFLRNGILPEIIGIVPFSPAAHESGLKNVNHVSKFLKDGFQLGDVPDNPLFRSVERTAFIGVGQVCDAI